MLRPWYKPLKYGDRGARTEPQRHNGHNDPAAKFFGCRLEIQRRSRRVVVVFPSPRINAQVRGVKKRICCALTLRRVAPRQVVISYWFTVRLIAVSRELSQNRFAVVGIYSEWHLPLSPRWLPAPH